MARGTDLDLEGAASVLDRLLADEAPRRPLTKTAKIKELKPKIVALRAKGFSWAAIADALTDVGGVSKDTLRHIVAEPRAAAKKAGSTRKRKSEEQKNTSTAKPQDAQKSPQAKGAFGTHDLGKGMG
jgi:hypothetical protein